MLSAECIQRARILKFKSTKVRNERLTFPYEFSITEDVSDCTIQIRRLQRSIIFSLLNTKF